MSYRVVVSSADRAFRGVARQAFSHHFDLSFCGEAFTELIGAARTADLVILDHDGRTESAIARFGRFLRLCPNARVIAVATGMDPVIALELVGCGAVDVLLEDHDPRILLRKAVRALEGGKWCVYDVPGLPQPTRVIEPVTSGQSSERRAAFRVTPFGDVVARVVIEQGNSAVLGHLHDLSLEYEDRPGGVAVSHDDVKLSVANRGTRLTAWLRFADDPAPIPLVLELVRHISLENRRLTAFTYTLAQRSDARRVRRFYTNERRKWQAKAASGGSAAAR